MSTTPDGIRVSALGQGETGRVFEWPTTARPPDVDEKVRQLLAYLARADIVVYGRSPLDELLNRPKVAPISADARGRLRDLLPAALIILPTETDYHLPSLTHRLGLQPYAEQDPLGPPGTDRDGRGRCTLA